MLPAQWRTNSMNQRYVVLLYSSGSISKENIKKGSNNKSANDENELESEHEAALCLICPQPFSKSEHGEEWIQ